jgi:hypothetical protein
MMVDRVEEAFNVTFDDSRNTPSGADLSEGCVTATEGAKPMRGVVKFRF